MKLKREYILGVLYDLSLTIGGEVSLESLLSKTLQKFLHHTGYPCGMVMLRNYDEQYSKGAYTLNTVIGDNIALKEVGNTIQLSDKLGSGKIDFLEAEGVLESIPCNHANYHFILKLPIGHEGVILLLSPQISYNQLPLQQMFAPILSHLAKAIHLCQLNDKQKEMLKKQVDDSIKKVVEREEKLSLLLASTAEGIFGLNNDGICTFANASALNMLGYDQNDSLVGEIIHDILHHTKVTGEPYPLDECPINRAVKDGDSVHVDDEVFWHKDGHSIPVEYRSTPIRKDNENIGQIITFVNITERLEAEKKQKEAESKLEHTQRLESLGVLTGGIAHDFNNLLTAILGNTTLTQQKIDPYSDEYALLDHVIEASESAADLCKQMLAYSGKGKFTINSIDLSDLVEKMTKLLDVSIHKGAAVRYNLKKDLPLIEGDIGQLRQVIMNLITNANEALEQKNGIINIVTGTVNIDEQYLASAFIEEDIKLGDYVFVEVSDSGCGMTEEQKLKIFEPFYTTKVSGRGLGMSAMLGIVRGHAGTLKIYSEVGKGTAIKVMFPASDVLPKLEPEVPKSASFDAQGKTVLVVDDELMLRKVTTAMLTRLGFNVISAKDGQEGLDKYIEHQDDISLVLLDMMMPVMNGEETFQKLRAINPDVKVLLCSGYNEQEATQQFTGKGLAGFIQKPYRVQALRDAVEEIL